MTIDLDAVVAAETMLLEALGVPLDEHTARTPERSAKAWAHRIRGYEEDPREHLGVTFPVEGADPGLVVITGIEVHSTCAHHLLPIEGVATVAYRPRLGGRVVGLSKLSRLVEGYARRLQVQEQLGSQVVTALQEVLQPVGAACIISAEHGCMTIRGVQQKGTLTTTHAFSGGWLTSDGGDRAGVLQEHHARL